MKQFVLEDVTSIYCMELSKLPFRVLVVILIKSWNQCIGFCTTLQQEGKSVVKKIVEMSFHWGNQFKFCIDSRLLLSCDIKVWHYCWREIQVVDICRGMQAFIQALLAGAVFHSQKKHSCGWRSKGTSDRVLGRAQ